MQQIRDIRGGKCAFNEYLAKNTRHKLSNGWFIRRPGRKFGFSGLIGRICAGGVFERVVYNRAVINCPGRFLPSVRGVLSKPAPLQRIYLADASHYVPHKKRTLSWRFSLFGKFMRNKCFCYLAAFRIVTGEIAPPQYHHLPLSRRIDADYALFSQFMDAANFHL